MHVLHSIWLLSDLFTKYQNIIDDIQILICFYDNWALLRPLEQNKKSLRNLKLIIFHVSHWLRKNKSLLL